MGKKTHSARKSTTHLVHANERTTSSTIATSDESLNSENSSNSKTSPNTNSDSNDVPTITPTTATTTLITDDDDGDDDMNCNNSTSDDEDDKEHSTGLLASRISMLKDWKKEGNDMFGRKEYSAALLSYDKAIELLLLVDTNNNEADNTTDVKHIEHWKEMKEIYIQVLSNRSLVLSKLQRFEESEHDCTYIINTLGVRDQPKVWYRRAGAYEGIANKLLETTTNNTNPIKAKEVLLLAKYDLQECLKAATTNNDNSLKLTVTTMAVRIQKSIIRISDLTTNTINNNNNISDNGSGTLTSQSSSVITTKNETIVDETTTQQRQQNGNSSVSAASKNMIIRPQKVLPSPKQQRDDIMRILIGRNLAILNHYRASQDNATSTSASTAPPQVLVGEAFVIINWKWWCHWVWYTGLLPGLQSSSTSTTSTDLPIVRFLPTGASIPEYEPALADTTSNTKVPSSKRKKKDDTMEIENENDEDSTSSSTTSSSDYSDNYNNDEQVYSRHFGTKIPGPIDNTNLLLLPSSSSSDQQNDTTSSRNIFYKQWYSTQHNHQSKTSSSSNNLTNGNKRHIDDGSQSRDTAGSTVNSALPALPPSTPPSMLQLRPKLIRGYHYEILPREVYFALQTWYGEVSYPICRRISCKSNDDSELSLELYPSPTVDYQNEARKIAKTCSACRLPGAAMTCNKCKSVRYCNQGCQVSHWPIHKVQCKDIAAATNNSTNNDDSQTNSDMDVSPFPYNDGRVGLNNLGNTCFMNAAIQCLSHSTPLTRYFLSGLFKSDINNDNPLGTGGKLAEAYAAVVKDLWWTNDNNTKCNPFQANVSISPTSIKRAIALFAPRFAGYLQHDTQEFLAYLLDGLHEDMNRIQRPPYVEMPDVSSSMDLSIAAAKCWDAYQRRNDSIVLDTFYGQFKSTCLCPTCNKVSVSFDTFNHVSLEIPQPNKPKTDIVPKSVLVYAADEVQNSNHASIPIKYAIQYDTSANYRIVHFRQQMAALCKIPPSNLVLGEVFNHSITNIYHDDNRRPFTDFIQQNIVAYELLHPFGDASIVHIIASHVLVDPTAAKQTVTTPQDRHPLPDPFGMPFITSLPDSSTCKDVWDHIWHKVGHLVNHVTESPANFSERSLLKIRLVDGKRLPRDVFKVVAPESKLDANSTGREKSDNPATSSTSEDYWDMDPQPSEPVEETTSILPSDSELVFKDCLGGTTVDSFVFFSLEWTDPTDEVQSDDEAGAESNIVQEHYIEEERFMAAIEHPSWVVASQKDLAARNAVPTKRRVKLEECFETFTKPERLDEHNMWYCSTCKAHVRATKTMQLWKLPNILIIHLKRFEFKQNHGFRREKLDTLVDFPLNGLEMGHHSASTTNSTNSTSFINDTVPAVYDCFAVTNHFGSMGFGHYTAFARKWNEKYGTDDNWALFDDATIRPVDKPSDIISPAAYVLFYLRRVFS